METEKPESRIQIANELVEAVDSKFFKTLSEPVRVQILKFLMLNGRADIQTIAENMPQDRSVVSRHLNLMQEAGVLTCQKENRHVFYDVNGQPFLEKLVDITEKIRKCVKECCPDCCK
ncbi:winged helix-turn-helix domain-containing protein [bacterium]|nr:winged helix-turn-helix domain-containing protein [bacterium]